MAKAKYHLHLKGYVGGYDFDSDYVDYILNRNPDTEVHVLIDSLGGSLATALSIVAAFRKACCLYAANGMKWEKTIENFCRWSFTYDMWIKMVVWGNAIRDANKDVQTSKRGPSNLLEQITANNEGVFCYRDAVNVRLQNGMTEEGTGNMLSQWKCRKHILQLTDDTYKKLH